MGVASGVPLLGSSGYLTNGSTVGPSPLTPLQLRQRANGPRVYRVKRGDVFPDAWPGDIVEVQGGGRYRWDGSSWERLPEAPSP